MLIYISLFWVCMNESIEEVTVFSFFKSGFSKIYSISMSFRHIVSLVSGIVINIKCIKDMQLLFLINCLSIKIFFKSFIPQALLV